jgi:hypothetical protein
MPDQVVLKVHDKDQATPGKALGLEAHPIIKQGTVVTWRHSEPFYVTVSQPNPCKPAPTGPSNVYVGTLKSQPGAKPSYEASCEIGEPATVTSVPYALTLGSAPGTSALSSAAISASATPCRGCALAMESGN